MKLFLLFCLLGTSLALNVSINDPLQRIIGGTKVVDLYNQFPWMASVQLQGAHKCGGTIIDKRWVMTSANCVAG